ncbi:hypothetical protein WN51_01495 [Melipona quadrifasciata]|uniref:Uncharacterized protein n=1 Tax=Melipona quadrifasciata TaxID=166423 RepID=A0A0M8ZY21_9HYME|nr:hypothetical protein WN51_01495 [Melipona quadrifasciata]
MASRRTRAQGERTWIASQVNVTQFLVGGTSKADNEMITKVILTFESITGRPIREQDEEHKRFKSVKMRYIATNYQLVIFAEAWGHTLEENGKRIAGSVDCRLVPMGMLNAVVPWTCVLVYFEERWEYRRQSSRSAFAGPGQPTPTIFSATLHAVWLPVSRRGEHRAGSLHRNRTNIQTNLQTFTAIPYLTTFVPTPIASATGTPALVSGRPLISHEASPFTAPGQVNRICDEASDEANNEQSSSWRWGDGEDVELTYGRKAACFKNSTCTAFNLGRAALSFETNQRFQQCVVFRKRGAVELDKIRAACPPIQRFRRWARGDHTPQCEYPTRV